MINKPLANPSKAAGVAAFDLSFSVVNDPTVSIKTRVAFPRFKIQNLENFQKIDQSGICLTKI